MSSTMSRLSNRFHPACDPARGGFRQYGGHPLARSDTPAERHQQLLEWNDTAAAFLNDICVHEMFEAQVVIDPQAIAVVFGDRQLTYGESNAQASQLAHYLLNVRQVTHDRLVGICVDRSFEMVIAILAIMKAGTAYVPLDPEYPQARLAWMHR